MVDIHSGGKTLNFVPSAVMHQLDDEDRMRETLDALAAFGAPIGLVIKELDAEGMSFAMPRGDILIFPGR